MMTGVNYVIYSCSSARTISGVSLCRSLTLEENIVAVLTHSSRQGDRWQFEKAN